MTSDNVRWYLLKQLDWKWCAKAANAFQTFENVYISSVSSCVAVVDRKYYRDYWVIVSEELKLSLAPSRDENW